MLEPHSLTWFVRRSQSDSSLGGATGNPRIRNRSSMLGRLQVGEFSSIIGLIKRAQTVYGRIFTVSGVMCAFHQRALQDIRLVVARGNHPDDVEVSWRIQLAGWHLVYEPKGNLLDSDAGNAEGFVAPARAMVYRRHEQATIAATRLGFLRRGAGSTWPSG